MRYAACLLLTVAVSACRSKSADPNPTRAADGAAPSASADPPRPAISDRFFVASNAMVTWIYERPDTGSRKLGYLRAGAVMKSSEKPVSGGGCAEGFFPVEPAGYVCIAQGATRSAKSEVVRAASRRPNADARLPYLYGIVKSASPMYARLPDKQILAENEPDLERHMTFWLGDDKSGAGYGQEVWLDGRPASPVSPATAFETSFTETDRIPWFLANGRQTLNLSGLVTGKDVVVAARTKRRNGLAFVDSFVFEGRRYAVTTDLLVMPADRLRPIHGSDFHGWEIPRDIDFPFALIRREGARRYRYENGKLSDAGAIPWRSAVALTGKQAFFSGRLHFEAKDHTYVSDQYASRLDPPKKMPGWGANGEKWIDINISKQTLVAYEGTKAVFATLVSTGEAGLGDPETTKSTARGIFRIHTKHLTATMDSDVVGEEFELRDIPYVQYFQDGYALHAAYWHDRFGRPKSHGCVNLSPEDARRLFFWTEPALPPGWHGVMRPLTGTVVFVHQ
jgi:L,D-transpeptidase catalytic domain